MLPTPCPHCGERDKIRAVTPMTPYIDYFRCASCGHVWTVSKDGKVRNVTVYDDKNAKG